MAKSKKARIQQNSGLLALYLTVDYFNSLESLVKSITTGVAIQIEE
jgi:hypothetical protein